MAESKEPEVSVPKNVRINDENNYEKDEYDAYLEKIKKAKKSEVVEIPST